MASASREHRLNLRTAGKTYRLDFRQAFRFGYTLLRARRFKEAASVFDALMRLGDPDHLAAIMLAYCKALVKDYQGSQGLLVAAFPGNRLVLADQLHTAFVYVSLGMWTDAVEELTAIVEETADLPVVCLLLGDLFAALGKRSDAVKYWRYAAGRDRKDGAVRAVLEQQMASCNNSHPAQSQ